MSGDTGKEVVRGESPSLARRVFADMLEMGKGMTGNFRPEEYKRYKNTSLSDWQLNRMEDYRKFVEGNRRPVSDKDWRQYTDYVKKVNVFWEGMVDSGEVNMEAVKAYVMLFLSDNDCDSGDAFAVRHLVSGYWGRLIRENKEKMDKKDHEGYFEYLNAKWGEYDKGKREDQLLFYKFMPNGEVTHTPYRIYISPKTKNCLDVLKVVEEQAEKRALGLEYKVSICPFNSVPDDFMVLYASKDWVEKNLVDFVGGLGEQLEPEWMEEAALGTLQVGKGVGLAAELIGPQEMSRLLSGGRLSEKVTSWRRAIANMADAAMFMALGERSVGLQQVNVEARAADYFEQFIRLSGLNPETLMYDNPETDNMVRLMREKNQNRQFGEEKPESDEKLSAGEVVFEEVFALRNKKEFGLKEKEEYERYGRMKFSLGGWVETKIDDYKKYNPDKVPSLDLVNHNVGLLDDLAEGCVEPDSVKGFLVVALTCPLSSYSYNTANPAWRLALTEGFFGSSSGLRAVKSENMPNGVYQQYSTLSKARWEKTPISKRSEQDAFLCFYDTPVGLTDYRFYVHPKAERVIEVWNAWVETIDEGFPGINWKSERSKTFSDDFIVAYLSSEVMEKSGSRFIQRFGSRIKPDWMNNDLLGVIPVISGVGLAPELRYAQMLAKIANAGESHGIMGGWRNVLASYMNTAYFLSVGKIGIGGDENLIKQKTKSYFFDFLRLSGIDPETLRFRVDPNTMKERKVSG